MVSSLLPQSIKSFPMTLVCPAPPTYLACSPPPPTPSWDLHLTVSAIRLVLKTMAPYSDHQVTLTLMAFDVIGQEQPCVCLPLLVSPPKPLTPSQLCPPTHSERAIRV